MTMEYGLAQRKSKIIFTIVHPPSKKQPPATRPISLVAGSRLPKSPYPISKFHCPLIRSEENSSAQIRHHFFNRFYPVTLVSIIPAEQKPILYLP